MARPKRMGAYNALDDLLPSPDPPSRPRLVEPVPDRPPRRLVPRRRAPNALDELLPGPGRAESGRQPAPGRRPARSRLEAVPGPRHLDGWNPLDELPVVPGPGPAPAEAEPPAKARVTLRLPTDLVQDAREAAAALASSTGERRSLAALAERALRAELARLATGHPAGRSLGRRS